MRREIALALHGAKEVAPMWARLAQKHEGADRWYLEALGIGAAGNDEACFDTWLQAVGGPEGHWNTPGGRDLIWRLRTAKTLPFLAQIITDPQTSPNEVPRYLRAFDFHPASEEKTTVLTGLAKLGEKNDFVAGEALERLENVDLHSHPDLEALVNEMVKTSRGTPRFLELVRDFKLPGQSEGLMELALARPSSPEGVESAKLLLGTDAALVQAKLAGPEAAHLTEALGNTADARAVALLAPRILDTSLSADLRKQTVKSLAQSEAGDEALLKLAARRGPGEFFGGGHL